MREIIYDTLSTDNGVTIYDSRSINWSDFKFDSGYRLHKIEAQEIYKPYMISAKYYNTIEYEDVLLILNNIEDIFEVVPGTEIKIPSLNELKTFILNNRK